MYLFHDFYDFTFLLVYKGEDFFIRFLFWLIYSFFILLESYNYFITIVNVIFIAFLSMGKNMFLINIYFLYINN